VLRRVDHILIRGARPSCLAHRGSIPRTRRSAPWPLSIDTPRR
jgi:hypothetical protein